MTEQAQPSPLTDYQPQWSDWTRRAVTIGLVVATVYALTLITPVIQVIVAAFLIAFLMYTPIRFFAYRTRLNFSGSVAVMYFLLVMLIVLFVLTFLPGFVGAVNGLVDNIQTRYTDFREYVLGYEPGSGVIHAFGMDIVADPIIQSVRDLLVQLDPTTTLDPANVIPETAPQEGTGINLESAAPALASFTSLLTGAVSSIGNFSSSLLLSLFLSFLILIDLPKYQHSLLNSIPRAYHRETMLLVDRILDLWNGFFKGQGIIAVIIGVLTWIQLLIMGIPQASVLAVFTAVISLIPTIGGIIALVPLGLVPLLQGSTVFTDISNVSVMLLVVVGNLILSQVIWNGVAPRILGNVVALPVPAIIVGVVIGAAVGGVLGAFLIVPILGTLKLIVLYLMAKIGQRDPFPGEHVPYLEDLATL